MSNKKTVEQGPALLCSPSEHDSDHDADTTKQRLWHQAVPAVGLVSHEALPGSKYCASLSGAERLPKLGG